MLESQAVNGSFALEIGGLGAGELDWHFDQSHGANPAAGAALYMVELPRAGGRMNSPGLADTRNSYAHMIASQRVTICRVI